MNWSPYAENCRQLLSWGLYLIVVYAWAFHHGYRRRLPRYYGIHTPILSVWRQKKIGKRNIFDGGLCVPFATKGRTASDISPGKVLASNSSIDGHEDDKAELKKGHNSAIPRHHPMLRVVVYYINNVERSRDRTKKW